MAAGRSGVAAPAGDGGGGDLFRAGRADHADDGRGADDTGRAGGERDLDRVRGLGRAGRVRGTADGDDVPGASRVRHPPGELDQGDADRGRGARHDRRRDVAAGRDPRPRHPHRVAGADAATLDQGLVLRSLVASDN